MHKAVNRVLGLMEFIPKDSVCFISRGRLENIFITDILQIRKEGTETIIQTARQQYRTYHSLQELLNELPVNEFARVHRSYVVALRSVTGIHERQILVNGQQLPLSDYYRQQLRRKLSLLPQQVYAWCKEV